MPFWFRSGERRGAPAPRHVAACVVLLAFVWLSLTVSRNYGGNWTALFCHGGAQRLPAALTAGTYVFPGSTGFDGQFYRIIAHDPLLRLDSIHTLDDAALRWRRILLPGLAALFGWGNPALTDGAFIFLQLGFLFAGVWFTSVLATLRGYPASAGLLFLAFPGVISSLDRMVVDLPALAIAAGLLYARLRERPRLEALLLIAALLCRETMVCFWIAWLGAALLQRKWKRAGWILATALPAALWALYVASRTSHLHPDPLTGAAPFSGLVQAVLHPLAYPFSPPLALFLTVLSQLSLAAFVYAFGLGILAIRKRVWDEAHLAIAAWSGLLLAIAFTARQLIWDEVYSYGRFASPFLFLVLWTAPSRMLVPLLLLGLTAASRLGTQMLGVVGLKPPG